MSNGIDDGASLRQDAGIRMDPGCASDGRLGQKTPCQAGRPPRSVVHGQCARGSRIARDVDRVLVTQTAIHPLERGRKLAEGASTGSPYSAGAHVAVSTDKLHETAVWLLHQERRARACAALRNRPALEERNGDAGPREYVR